jgi:ATP-dependent Clp protease ATP-binding subunit ClpA
MSSGSLEELIARVESASRSPLERLDEATAVREALAADADRVMDHFVGQARESGESWTTIGERLGISKQAARQRFADRVEPVLTFQMRPRMQACLDQAEREARADGSSEIGTHHLLAGLLAEGVAAAVLEKVGLTAGAIRESGRRLFDQPSHAADAVRTMSAEARYALEAAAGSVRASAATGDAAQAVGTEHVLAVLALDPGSRSRRILNDLDVDVATIKRELSCFITVNPRRRRRHGGKFRKDSTCSFCGRPAADVGHLVAGPGVWICAGCVGIAADVLGIPLGTATQSSR